MLQYFVRFSNLLVLQYMFALTYILNNVLLHVVFRCLHFKFWTFDKSDCNIESLEFAVCLNCVCFGTMLYEVCLNPFCEQVHTSLEQMSYRFSENCRELQQPHFKMLIKSGHIADAAKPRNSTHAEKISENAYLLCFLCVFRADNDKAKIIRYVSPTKLRHDKVFKFGKAVEVKRKFYFESFFYSIHIVPGIITLFIVPTCKTTDVWPIGK